MLEKLSVNNQVARLCQSLCFRPKKNITDSSMRYKPCTVKIDYNHTDLYIKFDPYRVTCISKQNKMSKYFEEDGMSSGISVELQA